MKLSRKICDCAQSPIRKFYPYAVAAQQRGIRIHQLNIGQPDIQTPPAFFEAIEAGRRDVLAYAESPGIPALLEAIRAYYARIGASFETQDILVTTGGSVREVMDIVAEAKAEVVGVCVVVDRSGGKIDFGVPFEAAYETEIQSYEPSQCPLCEQGLELVKPGSRKLK